MSQIKHVTVRIESEYIKDVGSMLGTGFEQAILEERLNQYIDEAWKTYRADTEEEDTAHIAVLVAGTLEENDSLVRLCYEEIIMESEEHIRKCLCFSKDNPNLITLHQSGENMNATLTFQEGETYQCPYSLEFGDLIIDVSTTRLVNHLLSEGCLLLEYDLRFGSSVSEHNFLTVQIDECRKREHGGKRANKAYYEGEKA